MIIREVEDCRLDDNLITKVTLEYVGDRFKTIILTQEDLGSFDSSEHFDIANFIKHKYGTDY